MKATELILVVGAALIWACPATSAAPRLEIKSVRLGMTYEELRAIAGDLSCAIGELPDGTVDADCDASGSDIGKTLQTVAGRPVISWHFVVKAGLLTVAKCDLTADDASAAARAFRSKYGAPFEESQSPVQNALGTHAIRGFIAWKRGKETLAVSANLRKFGDGNIILMYYDPSKTKPDI